MAVPKPVSVGFGRKCPACGAPGYANGSCGKCDEEYERQRAEGEIKRRTPTSAGKPVAPPDFMQQARELAAGQNVPLHVAMAKLTRQCPQAYAKHVDSLDDAEERRDAARRIENWERLAAGEHKDVLRAFDGYGKQTKILTGYRPLCVLTMADSDSVD